MNKHGGDTLVLRRDRLLLETYRERAIWHKRLVVGHVLRRRSHLLVAVHVFGSLSVRVLVCAVCAVAESASTRRGASMVAGLHVRRRLQRQN